MLITSTWECRWGWRCCTLVFNAGDAQLLLPQVFPLYLPTFITNSAMQQPAQPSLPSLPPRRLVGGG